jgi:Ser/Thr protein kinase RdoA (MazF antagonist)
VDWPDGTAWVARAFPSDRPLEAAQGDAAVLRVLEHAGYPAERCAHEHAVSVFEERKILVTKFVDGPRARPGPKTLYRLGSMLGRLSKIELSASMGVTHAGTWHHMSTHGRPLDDIALAKRLLADSKSQLADDQKALCSTVQDELDLAEDGHDLPTALIHPDFVPSNVIAPTTGGLVVIDWAGAGIGPRILGLGFLLFAAGARDLALVDEVMKGYSSQVALQQAELDRLEGACQLRPLIIACWEYFTGRKSLETVVQGLPGLHNRCEAIAQRARVALNNMSSQGDHSVDVKHIAIEIRVCSTTGSWRRRTAKDCWRSCISIKDDEWRQRR